MKRLIPLMAICSILTLSACTKGGEAPPASEPAAQTEGTTTKPADPAAPPEEMQKKAEDGAAAPAAH